MTILLLTHSYPTSVNTWKGIFIKEQAKVLSSKFDVIVVSFKVDYSCFAPFGRYTFSKESHGNLTEYEVIIKKSFPIITQLKYLLNTYRFIKKEIMTIKKPDLINSHLSYPAGFLGTLIQLRKGIPNVITEHTWIKKYFRSRIHKFCVLFALRKCAGVIAVSNALKEDIQLYSKNQVTVIPNVVEVERFRLHDVSNESIINLGILGGYSNYRKGLDILLKAASLIRNKNFLIHVGGDGTLLNSYKKLAKDLGVYDKCRFYGEIIPENVSEFYSALDIFILSSRDETFGVVVIEAMASGLPVIATKCGGPSEIISENTGLLVEKENYQELALAIDTMMQNLNFYDRVAIRRYAGEKYGPEAFIMLVTQLYKDILQQKASYSG